MNASVDTLIQNAFVVTFDDALGVISDGAVAIDRGVIVDIGPTADLTGRWHPANRIFASGRIAMPGLTDAHLHTAQTLMRGMLASLQKDRRLRVPTWREYYVPFEAALREEDVELSGLLAYTSILTTGTTSFFEAGGPHPSAMARAAEHSGIRGMVSLSTMDGGDRLPGSSVMTTDEAISRNIELVEELPYATDGSARVSAAMSLRQIITCTPHLVKTVHDEATARGVKVHTHLVEGTYEIDHALERYGRRPIDYLVELGVFTPTLHGAHSILASDDDVDLFAQHGVSACHCAKGNYSIGRAPALRMWRRGVDIGLGTDGVATLGTLDLFRVALLTNVGQQAIEATPVHNRNGVRADEPLRMAAIGGSRAMGLGAQTGTLTAGKRADVVLLRTDGPDAAGYVSEEAFLYEAATGRDVDTVLVDGDVVVSGGQHRELDLGELARTARPRQTELLAAIG
jgi:5-methylthioadenosine/S-adenosylhomocysteine deaminase